MLAVGDFCPNAPGGTVDRTHRIATLALAIALGLAIGCGGRADLGADEAGPVGGASGANPSDAWSPSDDASDDGAGSNTGGSGGTAGSSGGTDGSGGSSGTGGTSATGGTAGTTGGVGGSTGGAAGTGGSSGPPDAGDLPDISFPTDVARPDATRDARYDECAPSSCSFLGGSYCGRIGDGCGAALDCGSCTGGNVCGPRMPNVCGVPCPLCPQIQRCESGVTSVSGKVVSGAATNPDPIYRALVYIPNIASGDPLPPVVDGPSCTRCTPLTTDRALAVTVSSPDGVFVLNDVPAGTAIPLVVELGHWRYQTSINVLPCVNNPLADGTARLPRTQSEGNIPLTAVSTGNTDALECVLRKMGVADSEFSNPTGSGRIHLYKNNGAAYDTATPTQAALVDTQAGWDRYDQILFPCEGLQSNESAQALQNFINYTSKGGRVLTTHFSYTWLYQNGGFATAGSWLVNQVSPVSPLISNIDTTTTRGQDFATWLGAVGALSNTTPPQLSINDPRRNLNAVPAGQGGERWIYAENPALVQLMVVDTPVAVPPPDERCGRVIYSDFHVANAANTGLTFPAECPTGDLTPQEKALEFMLLHLASCGGLIDPPPPPGGGHPIPPPPPTPAPDE
jgi:hypothetical protein